MARHFTSLYLGFGGSGSKTLREFAELVASHCEMGFRSETNFAFLLFDTDRADLEKGKAGIDKAFANAGRSPVVKTFCLSKDFPTFNTKAGPRLVKAFEADAKEGRLVPYWWSEEQEGGDAATPAGRTPFTAQRFPHSPEIGAGQAPLISTFLTWHWLDAPSDSIRDLIRDTVKELKLRNTAAGRSQDLGLETTVIAGLAGGTGRGCWHLLSLVVSQILKDEGQTNHPVGLFFDVSTLPEVISQRPEWKMKMTINSLTGFSELVGYRRNELDDIRNAFHVKLPSLTRPSDSTADIIDTRKLVGQYDNGTPFPLSGYGPVSRAMVLFGGGRAGALAESSLYYKVAANVLYARFNETIQGMAANTNEFGSVGCASFVVPIASVIKYAEMVKPKLVAGTLLGSASQAGVTKLVDAITGRLEVGSTTTGTDDDSRQLFERVQGRLMTALPSPSGIASLEKVDPAKAKVDLEKALNHFDTEAGQAEVRQVVTDVMREALIDDAAGDDGRVCGVRLDHGKAYAGAAPQGAPIIAAVTRMVQADGAAIDGDGAVAYDLRGLLTKAAILRGVADWLLRQLPALEDLTDGGASAAVKEIVPGEKKAVLELFSKYSGTGVASIVDSINPSEAKSLIARLKAALRSCAAPIIAECLHKEFQAASDHLITIATRIEKASQTLSRVALGSVPGAGGRGDFSAFERDKFWTPRDFERVRTGSAKTVVYKSAILGETEIKPILEDVQSTLAALVGDKLRRAEGALDAVRPLLMEHAFPRGGSTGGSPDSQLERRLGDEIRKAADRIDIGLDSFRAGFSFRKVVAQHLRAWRAQWYHHEQAPMIRENLKREFLLLFGARLEDFVNVSTEAEGAEKLAEGDLALDDHAIDDAAVNRLCMQMATQVGHRCDVLVIQQAEESHAIDRATVILPAEKEFSIEYAADCEKYARGTGLFKEHGFRVLSTTNEHDGSHVGDVFTMLGYASEDFKLGAIGDDAPLELVSSLTRQYQESPDVLAWLAACEDADGASVFAGSGSPLWQADKSFGLGYSFPFWVTDERMRKCRWRPWARKLEQKAMADAAAEREADAKEFVTDALLYALLRLPDDGELKAANLRFPSEMTKPGDDDMWALGIVKEPSPTGNHLAKWTVKRSPYRELQGKRAEWPCFSQTEFEGVLSLKEAFEDASRECVVAVAGEATLFFDRILPARKTLHSPDAGCAEMFSDLGERLRALKSAIQGKGETQVRVGDAIEGMAARCDRLKRMKCAELARHFGRRA